MSTQYVFWVIGALAGVIMIIVVGGQLLRSSRWLQQSRPGRTLALRESLALDPRRRIHLVRCGERDVLLLTGGGQDVVIGWIPES